LSENNLSIYLEKEDIMARKWKVVLDGVEHAVEVKIHMMGEREVLVDSRVVKALSPSIQKARIGLFGPKARIRDLGDQVIEFEIAGKPAVIQRKQFSLAGSDYNLYVDGQKIE
jgi:uncharacterized protein YacL (UPF0231 family)